MMRRCYDDRPCEECWVSGGEEVVLGWCRHATEMWWWEAEGWEGTQCQSPVTWPGLVTTRNYFK